MRHRVVVLCASLVLAFAVYAAESGPFTPAQRNFWSLVPVKRQAVPAVKNQAWVKNPIDAFVLAKLEEKNLTPNPPADRLTLLRRATIDMTGLPPTPEETQQFLNDKSPTAYEKIVDRLLASPAYGERWARHWLDVVRYADSNGFKADETRPNIWRYRDYVIKSLNEDKPYDRFIKEQVAGDEIYPGSNEALVAMGFNRHWIDESNSSTLFLRRQETLDDMTTVTAETFLGLTFGCARCHNHKFDPILQKDYYRLQAFFANTGAGDGPLHIEDADARKKYEEQMAAWEEKTKDIRAEIAKIEAPLRMEKMKTGSAYYQPEVQEAIFMDPAKRDPVQAMMAHTARGLMATNAAFDAKVLRDLKEDDARRYAELNKQLAEFDSIKPAPLPEAQFMTDISSQAPKTFLLKGGNLDLKGDEIQPGFLSILDPSDAKITPLKDSTGRRTALAGWLTDPKNPLVARVMVNRIWNYNFDRGIAATPGDFGLMGSRPTHPELLDYLASAFVDNGWSIKKMNRMILLSNTYQQSSEFQAKAAAVDPDNKLIWRYGRHRMEAEAIRDSMLAVSGMLNPQMGGPGVFPPVPPGTLASKSNYGRWSEEKDPAQNNRRSVYIFVRRNLRYPMLQEFDSANTFESCDFRKNTVTPSQSLDLLNNGLILDWAQALAGRILNDNGLTPEAQVERAFKMTYGREPNADEKKLALDFLAKQSAIMAQRLASGETTKPPLPANMPAGIDPARAAAVVDLSQMLMDSNEFLYIN